MRPFFSFYGSKWRAAKHFPKPEYDLIIEPFAGSAGYSTRYGENKDVLLCDVDPVICTLWAFLISNKVFDNKMALSYLRGFWFNHGCTAPAKSPSKWMREGNHNSSFWGPEIQKRIKKQMPLIKRWNIMCVPYEGCPDIEATWFIDPPYTKQGKHYTYNYIDYKDLAKWCRSRKGQVIVCEQEGAGWLPFKPFKKMKSTKGVSKEVWWYKNDKTRV